MARQGSAQTGGFGIPLTDEADRAEGDAVPYPSAILSRLKTLRWALAAVALVLLALVALAGLMLWQAVLIWFAVVSAGALAPIEPDQAGHVPSERRSGAERPGYEAVVAAIANPVILLDSELTVLSFNKAAIDIQPNLRPGEPIAFALRIPEVIDAVRAVAAVPGRRQVEYAERVPVERAVEAHISTIPGENGATAFVVVMLRDLTQARRVEQMRVDFVANASHELRTPLASLLGFVETLQGPARNDTVAREKFLGIMRAQATRMSRLIEDLLSLSRIELNAHVRPDKPIDLVPIIGHIADTLAPLALERSVAVTIEKQAETLNVLGERDELIRVFENLVENAIKYGASGGRVEITLAAQARSGGRAEEAVVTIRDHGPGIPAEHVPRLTERFYRVDVAQSREKGGTGRGLAIVKHIVARHRGRLTIESEVGEGSAFAVRLDRLEAGAAEARSAP